MQKSKNRISLALSIIFAILSGLMLFMAIFIPKNFIKNFTNLNTVEYRLTVKSVETGEDNCTVFVEEFDCGLLFYSEEIIYEDYLDELKSGVKINVKILEMMEEDLSNPNNERMFILAIKTDNKEIVTLESHKVILEKQGRSLSLSGYVLFSVLVLLTLICFVLFIRSRKYKKQTT